MVQIKWTPTAVGDLQSIHEFISHDSELYAQRQVLKIKSRTQLLKRYPLIGRIVPEFARMEIRELVEGNYRIIYKVVTTHRIDILTIQRTSRNLKKTRFH